MSIEKIWKTKAGHKAVVLLVRNSHRCGYVGVPEGHPLYGKHYNDQLGCLKSLESSEELGKRSPLAVFGAALTEETNSMGYVFNVHGGVTWTGHFLDPKRDKEEDSELTEIGKEYVEAGLDDGLWYIGYDCNHYNDGNYTKYSSGDPIRELPYCEAECESLSQQIIDRVIVPVGDQEA